MDIASGLPQPLLAGGSHLLVINRRMINYYNRESKHLNIPFASPSRGPYVLLLQTGSYYLAWERVLPIAFPTSGPARLVIAFSRVNTRTTLSSICQPRTLRHRIYCVKVTRPSYHRSCAHHSPNRFDTSFCAGHAQPCVLRYSHGCERCSGHV